jgi:F0F1-type ATP synthase, delta subunit (mitochondrial oligomycin sensitivity protein)
MNAGIIASRYAAALLMLVQETGSGDVVVRQVLALQKALLSVQGLSQAIGDSTEVSTERKLALFEACLGDEAMAPDLRKFLSLLIRKGRINDASLVFSSFVSAYYKSKGIKRGRLVVPKKGEGIGDLVARLERLVQDSTGSTLELEVDEDPSIIGGFVFEMEDNLLDASVSHQLDLIRRQFVERNRRIV